MRRDQRIGRRNFLQTTAIAAFALSLETATVVAEDRPAFHNMLVFGEQSVFLSHLPMFANPGLGNGLDSTGTEFESPHRYQVILEAAFTKEQLDNYIKDRLSHPAMR